MPPYTLLTQNDKISPQDRHSTSLQTNIFCNFYSGHPVVFQELQDKLVIGCGQTQQSIWLSYCNSDMFWS